MIKFLSEDSKISSMRLTLFLGTLCIMLLVIAMCVYMIVHAYKYQTLDWSGMAIFLGAISAFTGTLLYGKVQQKKVETNAAKNTDNKSDSSSANS